MRTTGVLRDQSKEARRASIEEGPRKNARGCAAAGLLFWCSPKKELAETTRKNDGSDQAKEVQKNRITSLLRKVPVAASDERNEDSARFRGLFHYFMRRNRRNLRK